MFGQDWRGNPNLGIGNCGRNVSIGHNVTITNSELVSLGNNVRIDPNVYISGALTTGDYVQICTGAVLGGAGAGITLGNWTFIGYGSQLFTGSEDYRGLVNAHWGAGGEHSSYPVRKAPIVFEDYAGIASQVVVMPGVRLWAGTRIGARSFVHKTPEFGWRIYYGNPLEMRGRVDQDFLLEEARRMERK